MAATRKKKVTKKKAKKKVAKKKAKKARPSLKGEVKKQAKANAGKTLAERLAAYEDLYAVSPVIYEGHVDEFVPTRFPRLNRLLGGGLKKGGVVEMFGDFDSGKTSGALAFAADVQRQAPKGKDHVIVINYEGPFDYRWWRILGIDTSKVRFTQLRPGSLEEGIGQAYDLIQSGEVCCLVIDSVYAAAGRQREQMMEEWRTPRHPDPKKRKKGAGLGVEAKLWSEAWTSLKVPIQEFGVVALAVNQVREVVNIGGPPSKGYGPKTKSTRGKALEFYSWVRLEIQGRWRESDDDKDGKVCRIRVRKNKNSRDALGFADYELIRGEGFDLIQDLIALATEAGAIRTKGGGNYYLGKKHFRGMPKLRAYVTDTPKVQEILGKVVERYLIKEIPDEALKDLEASQEGD